jgi:hypothetical protein
LKGYESFVMMKLAAGCGSEKWKHCTDKRKDGEEPVSSVTCIVHINTLWLCGMGLESRVVGS